MRKPVVRLLAAAGVLAAMACGAMALSSGDSLITLSYLQRVFATEGLGRGEAIVEEYLSETYDEAKGDLDDLQKDTIAQLTGGEDGLYSGTLQARDWSDGDEIEIPTGSGFLMLEGTASVTHNGAVVDVTEGTEVPSGGKLTFGHRYLVGEDTAATVTVLSGAARLGVQGAYDYADGGVKATPFYDVCRNDWYYAPVNYVYANKLFSGMSEHEFAPYGEMNRAMLMTVLYQLAGAPKAEMDAADVHFTDVPDDAWYAPYVRWGASKEITAGTGDNTFSPEMKINRQQVVVLLRSFAGRYLGLDTSAQTDLSAYEDLDQAADWAVEGLSWAVAEGIIGSSSSDKLTLNPVKNAGRAEVAAMLRAFSENVL